MRSRWSGHLVTYLGCSVLCSAFTLAGKFQELHGGPGEDPLPFSRLLGAGLSAAVIALVLGLFSIPVRLLLGLFPEPSPSSGVRLFRRCLLGALVGPVPAMVVLLLSGQDAKLQELVPLALLFGAVVGLMDSIVRDHAALRSTHHGSAGEDREE